MIDFELKEIKNLIATFPRIALTGDDFIDNRYLLHRISYGHTEPYYRFFYYLTRFLKPSLTVELGGWQGTGASHFASGNSEGIVVTIDHHSDPGDEENKRLMELAEKQYNNLVYLQGWTWDVKESVQIIDKGIDILFIDSWHQYEYAIRDWKDYSPMLNSPALVICDDILGSDGAVIAGMRKFWDELPGEKFLDETLRQGIPMGFLKHE